MKGRWYANHLEMEACPFAEQISSRQLSKHDDTGTLHIVMFVHRHDIVVHELLWDINTSLSWISVVVYGTGNVRRRLQRGR